VIKVANLTAPDPRVVASARHGGDLTDALRATGSWLVYLEYRQNGQTSSADFWYLNAVNWTNEQLIGLASATSGPALQELPSYDAADGRVVWNQLNSTGESILRMYDLGKGQWTTLPLPATMYPVQPTLSANSVVFVDNSTDPYRAQEDFFSRRGSIRRFDLSTNKITTLSSDPSAWMPQARGDEVIWTAMPSTGPSAVSGVQLEGGPITAFGSDPVAPLTDGSIVVWYDSSDLNFMAFGLSSHHLVDLKIGNWPDIRSVFALCGDRVFFALPPVLDGSSSTIRYFVLPAGQV